MAYYLSVSNPYSDSVGTPILDDPRKTPLTEMAYADPQRVDARSLRSNTVQMAQGYFVDPSTAPRKILWKSKKYPLPDVISNQQVIVANDRFRELVETFEPAVHQFIPVDVYTLQSSEPAARYSWFVVGQRLESVHRDQTTYTWMLDYTGQRGFWTNDRPDARLVFSRLKIGNHHIWMDPELLVFNCGLCSNAFGEAALAANFLGLNVTPREEV